MSGRWAPSFKDILGLLKKVIEQRLSSLVARLCRVLDGFTNKTMNYRAFRILHDDQKQVDGLGNDG